jgi:hypothetical protein
LCGFQGSPGMLQARLDRWLRLRLPVRERERETDRLCALSSSSPSVLANKKKSNIAVANLGFLRHCASSSAAVSLLLQSRENTMLNPTRSGK